MKTINISNSNRGIAAAYKLEPLSSLRVSTETRRKLRSYAERAMKGSKIIYRSTFYSVRNTVDAPVAAGERISGVSGRKPLSSEVILQAFKPHIFKDVEEYPTITKFEHEFEKYMDSSRSIVLPGKDRLPKLLSSYENQKKALKLYEVYPNADELLSLAANDLADYIHQYIKPHSIRTGSEPKIIQRMKKTTNGGAPDFKVGRLYSKGVLIEDNVPKYVEIAHRILEKIKSRQPIPIEGRSFGCLNRSQEGADGETKNRIVGGDAHGATIIAGKTYPLLDAFKRLPTRIVLKGMDPLNEAGKAYLRDGRKKTILSADQSAFDNHIRADIAVKYIVPIILGLMRFSDEEDELGVRGYLEKHMGEDPIICPDGVRFGLHGMPSGVLGVNEFDSLYLQFVTYLFNRLAGKQVYTTIFVQGDDQVIETTDSVETAAQNYSKGCSLINLEANEDKQGVAEDSFTFTRRLWTIECEDSYRSKLGSLIAEMNMERGQDWRDYMYEARGGSILCNHYLTNPGISQFFGNVSYGYVHLLGLDYKNGYYTILQKAGGVEEVSSRLELASYANHLGTHPKSGVDDAGELDVSQLTLMQWQKDAKGMSRPKPWLYISAS